MAHRRLDKRLAKTLLESVDSFVFDCDGVLWDSRKKALAGTVEALQLLRNMGKNVFFVTNNSSKSRADTLRVCQSQGFQANEEEFMCTAWMVAKYVKNMNKKGKVYMVGSKAMSTHFKEEGIEHFGFGEEPYGVFEQYPDTPLESDVYAVVVGFDPHVNYMKVLKACSYLQNPDVEFVATNHDAYFPTNGAVKLPGTGSIVAFVAYAAEREPTYIGKPSKYALTLLQQFHDNILPERTVMVGDRLDSDVLFGKNCGFLTLLTETGCHNMTDVNNLKEKNGGSSDKLPDYVIDSLGNLPNLLSTSE